MKYIFSKIIFLLLSCQTMFAQAKVDDLMNDSAKLYIEYADYQGYINDSIYSSLQHTSLFLGKKAAVYVYQTKTPKEFLKSMKENYVVTKGKVDKDEMIKSFKERYDIEKIVAVVYARYYNSPDFLLLKSFSDGDVWLSDTLVYKWNLVNEFKTINGYKCQKAINRSTDGNEVTAWFTEGIPFSVGPLYLSGLPGVILEYFNPKSKRFFKAITISSTNIPEQKFRKWLTGPIVSKAQFAEMYQYNSKKLEQFKRMTEGQKSTNR